jgi:hypothetical protein
MSHDGAKRAWGVDRLILTALALVCVVLGALNLWKWLATAGQAGVAAGVAASPSSHPVVAGNGAPPSERPKVEAGPASPDQQGRAESGEERGGRDRPEQQATGSPGGAAPAGPSVPVQESPPARLRAEDSREESPAPPAAASSPAAEKPAPLAPRQGAVPQEPKAAASDEKRSPEEKASAEAASTSDRTPPVLDQIRFEPAVVEGGKTTTLTILARDNLSGVKSLRGEIQSPSGAATLPIWLQDSNGGNSFTYVISIPAAAETGVWFVKWLYLTDVADNSALIQVPSATSAPPGGTFSVSSSESDSIAPDVLEISFARATIEDKEDRNVIKVEVRDDLSGVSSVAGTCQSSSKSAQISFTCALNSESGLWEGEVIIPGNAPCGAWSVQQLSAKDKAGNTTHLTDESPILARAGFTIAPRAECDSSPPTLDAFTLSQTIVPGDVASEILITAAVHDVGSGAVSMTGWFEGPVSEGGQVPMNHFNCTPDPEHPEAPWTGTVVVPQFAARGTWKVRVVRLEDKARNVREYTPADPVLSRGVFEVR